MKCVPMRLPMPREPECSITHTLPGLVEAELDEVVAAAERAELVHAADLLRRDLRVLALDRLVASAGFRRWYQALSTRARHVLRASRGRRGTAASIARRTAARLSGRSLGRERSCAPRIMPQPMSTPTAAGTIAPIGRDDAPDRRALAEMHVRHRGDVLVHERQPRTSLTRAETRPQMSAPDGPRHSESDVAPS